MEEKTKVLWLVHSFECGGAERQALYMYDLMKRYSDFDIKFIYYVKKDNQLDISGTDAIFIDKDSVGSLRLIKEISKYIKENDIKIMHAFSGCSANIYGRAGALFTKAIPVGALLGKGNFDPRGFKTVNSLLNIFGKYWTVNNSELIPVLKNKLRFVDSKKIYLLHNGFASASETDYHKDEHTEYDEDKKGSFVFCTVGRLVKVKNYPLFIRAAANIAQTNENVRFWMIGYGKKEEELKALANECGIADRIRFWGYRTDTDAALSRADAFVMTSFTEGSPNAIAEAMRAGKPVISTHSCDLSEMIENGRNGYIVRNDDLDDLTAAMKKILELNEQELADYGAHSQKMFNEHFSGEKVAKEISGFYNMLLNKQDRSITECEQ